MHIGCIIVFSYCGSNTDQKKLRLISADIAHAAAEHYARMKTEFDPKASRLRGWFDSQLFMLEPRKRGLGLSARTNFMQVMYS